MIVLECLDLVQPWAKGEPLKNFKQGCVGGWGVGGGVAGPDLCFRKPSPGRENALELWPTGRERRKCVLGTLWRKDGQGFSFLSNAFALSLPFHSGCVPLGRRAASSILSGRPRASAFTKLNLQGLSERLQQF